MSYGVEGDDDAEWEQALWKGYEDYEFLVTDKGYVKDMRKKI